MKIDVIISRWEQACSGGAFAVGERAAWSLHELAPELLARREHRCAPWPSGVS